MGVNYSEESKIITAAGGPGNKIGYGFTRQDAIGLAIANQLKRIADTLDGTAAGLNIGETYFGRNPHSG